MNMADCKHPDEKVGTKYRVVSNDALFNKGTIVVLSFNDRTRCPFFKDKGRECCIFWHKLEKMHNKILIGGELVK